MHVEEQFFVLFVVPGCLKPKVHQCRRAADVEMYGPVWRSVFGTYVYVLLWSSMEVFSLYTRRKRKRDGHHKRALPVPAAKPGHLHGDATGLGLESVLTFF